MGAQRLAVLFLAAGYGTRLQKDISTDFSGAYLHLLGLCKALLPLAGKPLLEHWLHQLSNDGSTPNSLIVCNDSNYSQFESWSATLFGSEAGRLFLNEKVFNDGSISNESRLGSCVDMARAVKHFNLLPNPINGGVSSDSKDLLVIAGDTLFLKDFNVHEFIRNAQKLNGDCIVISTVISDELTKKSGILEIVEEDVDGEIQCRVVKLLEKPGPKATKSRLGCPAFYYLKPNAIRLLDEYVAIYEKQGLEFVDACGKFIAWLAERSIVYAIPTSGRLDIGGLSSYIEADSYMTNNE
ncbi:hypothetical protein HK096_004034 [Nowakowskiella sp. JEL0078]|nr:hypothetical protein HK096_004034 [Nowakowskiella sp. JEL0078]